VEFLAGAGHPHTEGRVIKLKSIDDVPYVLIGIVLATVGFLVGNLIFHQHLWQVIVAPFAGAIMGFLAGLIALRGRSLPYLATLRDFKAAMKRETNR
jgi:ribose/xylose/arabinose/galactoside ABC-type transport system permease subunit